MYDEGLNSEHVGCFTILRKGLQLLYGAANCIVIYFDNVLLNYINLLYVLSYTFINLGDILWKHM